jgi:hypothetical protein
MKTSHTSPPTWLAALATLWATLACVQTNAAQAAGTRDARVVPAVDGIFETFRSYPLVGLVEVHGISELLDFYGTLVRDPRFASEVGHVVVEFGGASQQHIIDRYVNGETVPYAQLREVWNQTVGAQPTFLNEGYALFFAQVRQINLTLAPDKRIKVWLGEPPIDWSRVRAPEDYRPLLATRDSHAADVIVRNILAKGRKALIIYGSAHFDLTQSWENEALALIAAADPGGPMSKTQDATLRDLIEKQYPGRMFVAQAYRGFADTTCMHHFEQRMGAWPMPALAIDIAGTTVDEDMRKCLKPRSTRMNFPPSVPPDVQQRVRDLVLANADRDNPLLADSVLFYARAGDLTRSPTFLELTLDEEWRAELDRRNRIITGRPLPADWARDRPERPVAYTPRD